MPYGETSSLVQVVTLEVKIEEPLASDSFGKPKEYLVSGTLHVPNEYIERFGGKEALIEVFRDYIHTALYGKEEIESVEGERKKRQPGILKVTPAGAVNSSTLRTQMVKCLIENSPEPDYNRYIEWCKTYGLDPVEAKLFTKRKGDESIALNFAQIETQGMFPEEKVRQKKGFNRRAQPNTPLLTIVGYTSNAYLVVKEDPQPKKPLMMQIAA